MTPDSNQHENPIPSQLKRQIEEAEAIRAQMGEDGGAPPSEGDGDDQESGAEGGDATPPDSPPPSSDDESWEQRYRSQQGRMESLVATNRQMQERLNSLDKLVSTMQAGGKVAKQEPPPTPYAKQVTDQDKIDYGEDLLNVIGRRSRDEYAPEFDKLAQRLQRLEGRMDGAAQVMEKTEKSSVYTGLDQHVQGWRDINRHPVFKQWLAQIDPFSGRPRQEMLTEAFSRHETGRVVAFFRGFLAEAAGPPQEETSPGNEAPPLTNGNGSGRPSLEDFAAPGRARSAPQELPPDKPIYTSAQIAQFFADKRVGKWRGREADADAIERDIYQAQHEGRIQ